MKYALILTCMLLGLSMSAQEVSKAKGEFYATFDVIGYTREEASGAGPHISFGYHNNGFCIGPGIGMVLIGHDEPYTPIYVNVLYAGGKTKLTPMGKLHLGGVFHMNDITHGGFYGQAVAGLAIKFKKTRIHLFGGMAIINQAVDGIEFDVNQSVFLAGIGFFTTN